MRTSLAVAALAALIAAASVVTAQTPASPPADGRRISALVTRVIDGDTLVVAFSQQYPGLQAQERVRIIGVDCPESHQAPWGTRATRRLAHYVDRKPVLLELGVQSRDPYGRLLAGVYLPDGQTLVQDLLVREGFCDVLVIPPNVEYADRLRAAKSEAQSAKRGIWSISDGLTESPSEARRGRRGGESQPATRGLAPPGTERRERLREQPRLQERPSAPRVREQTPRQERAARSASQSLLERFQTPARTSNSARARVTSGAVSGTSLGARQRSSTASTSRTPSTGTLEVGGLGARPRQPRTTAMSNQPTQFGNVGARPRTQPAQSSAPATR